MHPVLLTIVALGINGDGPAQTAPAPTPHVKDAGCASCGPGGCAHASHREIKKALHAQHNMMPQSCYDPSFGCYAGSRFMNRYPAFHGTYYRRPYNYRNVFDYPWHADLHEPTSLFSYNVVAPNAAPAMRTTPQAAPREEEVVEPAPEGRSTSIIRRSRGVETTQSNAIGTGVRTSNPFRRASLANRTETTEEASSSSSSRRRTRRGAVTKPTSRR